MSLEGVLAAVVVVLTIVLGATAVLPDANLRVFAPSADLVFHAFTVLVPLGVAALALIRFRSDGSSVAVGQGAGFMVLAIANGFTLLVMTTGPDPQGGLMPAAPGPALPYVFALSQILAGGLLLLGSSTSLRGGRIPHPNALVLGSAVATAAVIAGLQSVADHLPALASLDLASTQGIPAAAIPLPSSTPLGALLAVVAGVLFLGEAELSRRVYRRDRSNADAFMAVGLLMGASALFETALHPDTYGLISTIDLLRLAFDSTLFVGVLVGSAWLLDRLRIANEDLERLRKVEVDRASLAERARLSRELHDGLAQDLWVAKLKTGRLAELLHLDPEARALIGELDTAIDAGIADAQQAVAALRLSAESTDIFRDLFVRAVQDFGDRSGLRVELSCDPGLTLLSTRTQAEVIRITQEALTNTWRHADATLVTVTAGMADGHLSVVVDDNGRGFDLDEVGGSAYGLASMRERAALMGAGLRVDTRPQDGTRVSLLVPLPAVAADTVVVTR